MSRPFPDEEPRSGSDTFRLTAQFDDQLGRLEALEAEGDAKVALRRFVQGDLTLSELSAHVTTLRDARARANAAACFRSAMQRKYSPDQPRDDRGRWTSGGGTSGGATATPTATQLGALSMVYETGFGAGHEAAAAARVSNGVKDKGGVSYGAFQLASRKGQVQAFLKSTGSQWASEFDGQDPTERGGAFGQTWKDIAARDPVAFFDAQGRYIQTTHYNPVVRRVLKATGLDINSRPLAVQQVVWSIAVQHGGAAKIIRDAVNDLDQWTSPSEPGYDYALINNLYDFRSQYVVTNHIKNAVKLLRRFSSERKMALSLFER